MEGGYKAWTAAGLRTKPEGTDTPISVLQEVSVYIKIKLRLNKQRMCHEIGLS